MKKAGILITITALSILGLIVLQVRWLDRTIKLSEEEFERKITKEVLPIFAFEYLQNLSVLDVTPEQIEENMKIIRNGGQVRTPFKTGEGLKQATQHIIDSVFRSHGINARVEFGIYYYDSEIFRMISDSSFIEELQSSPFKDCFNCAISFTSNTPNNLENEPPNSFDWGDRIDARRPIKSIIEDPDYKEDDLQMIVVYFPDRSPAILSQVSTQLAMAIVLIVILMGSFMYTLNTIRKQKKLSEIKKDFVNNLTHELKTPIASILLSTKVLGKSKTATLAPEDERFITLIQNEGKRLENHVDRVLQIAMLDSGNFSLDKDQVDLHAILGDVVSSLQVIIQQRNAEIVLNLKAPNAKIEGDEAHLFNLYYNLIENALKYSEKVPEIKIETSNDNGTIDVSIEDNGIGMNKEIQKNVFDRFYRGQTEDNYKEKGFGLGLSYVKSIVDEHDGEISLQSEPDKGTKFKITFDTTEQ